MNTCLYKFLDLPLLPKSLVDKALSVERNNENVASSHRFTDKDEKIYAARALIHNEEKIQHVRQTRYLLDQQFQQWISQAIARNFIECTVSIGGPQQGHLGPHTDRARNFVLIYVLVPGGSNVLTTFWQEQNQLKLRPRATLVDDYDRLIMLDQVDYGIHRWVIMDGRVLHSVQNLESSRINIQIAFDNLDDLQKRVGPLNFAQF
jgi:hypothetical protein